MAASFFLLFALLAAGAHGVSAQVSPGNAAYAAGDFARAFALFSEQAEAGEAAAQHNLGVMYLQGQGTERDFAAAARWFRQAAAQDIAEAQFELGLLHAQGRGVERDYERAVEWWQRAAAGGNARAAHHLGMQYLVGSGPGYGLRRDDTQAVHWFRRAAEMGHADSRYELGQLYLQGRGVDRDPVIGLMWLMLARESRSERDPQYLASVERRLAAGDVALARQKAAACRQSGYTHCG